MTDFRSGSRGRTAGLVLMVIVLLALWEASVRMADIKAFLLPAPSLVLQSIVQKPLWYLGHAYQTLVETFLGFGFAVVFGVLIAVGIVYSRILEQSLYTFLVAMNAVPKIAVAPLFVIWLGTELEPKVAVAALVAIFPIVIDTVQGLRAVDPAMLDLGRSLRGSRLKILWKIRAPYALPSVFAGLKVGISLAFIGAIVGEFISSQAGLGYVVVTSQANFDTTQMFAAILILALLSLLLFNLIELAEHLLLPWHGSRRREARQAQGR
ncbi:MAG TPA: ABC transporter permease [Burkholderiaceae bacterium]|nr:ABC transporter permease [Burkholderiaceae bacterium]